MTYKIGDTLPNGNVIIDMEAEDPNAHVDPRTTVLCLIKKPYKTEYVSWVINPLTGDASFGVYCDNLADAVTKFNERARRPLPDFIPPAGTVDYVVERRQYMKVTLPVCALGLNGDQVRALIEHYLETQGEDFQIDEDSWRYFTDDGEEI